MTDKICLITGATSGIGAAVAEALARLEATVIVVGRDQAKCEAVVDRIHRAGNRSGGYLVADLSCQMQIRRLVEQFKAQYDRLDVLINNAGGIFMRRGETVDGIERTFAVNHLAYFLLTHLLLDRLMAAAPARIINVASSGHALVQGIDLDDVQNRRSYRGFPAYHRSKLANIMFTYELARRLGGTAVTVNAVDPGIVATNIGRNNGLIWRLGKPVFDRLYRLRYVTPQEAAKTIVHVASSPDLGDVTGRYFADQRPVDSSLASHDSEASRRLWDVCGELVGLSPGNISEPLIARRRDASARG